MTVDHVFERLVRDLELMDMDYDKTLGCHSISIDSEQADGYQLLASSSSSDAEVDESPVHSSCKQDTLQPSPQLEANLPRSPEPQSSNPQSSRDRPAPVAPLSECLPLNAPTWISSMSNEEFLSFATTRLREV